ncbi:MAG: molybdopterin-guanine dinucleotide biosynthesis protein B [Caldimonas sp.]
MNVIGLCGFSGSGKTTLAERLIPILRLAGHRVSVVKHAHHDFDIDHEGKDSWRHRQAGAFEVVIASDRRLAKMREYPVEKAPTVDELIAELSPCDWVLVEGFKHAPMAKLEVWRAATGKRAQYPEDPYVFAIATDSRSELLVPTGLPVFDLDDAETIAAFIAESGSRCAYRPPGR